MKFKILRNCLVRGQHTAAGTVVELDEREARALRECGRIGAAVEKAEKKPPITVAVKARRRKARA